MDVKTNGTNEPIRTADLAALVEAAYAAGKADLGYCLGAVMIAQYTEELGRLRALLAPFAAPRITEIRSWGVDPKH